MDTVFTFFLVLHIAGGAIGLLTGLVNVVRKKGDKKHRIAGRVFLYSMLSAGSSSLVLSLLHPNYFLFMVGVFTLYLVGTGYRYLYSKIHNTNEKPKPIDWFITFTMLVAATLFIGIGILYLVKSSLFGLVFITFGLFGLLFVRHDFTNYRGNSKIENYWLTAHLQRMTGGFIAALTAFLVVNSNYFPEQIPGFVYWLLPTLVFTPLIISWSRKFEVKKNKLK
jgi:uncharacterized membrane protein